MRDFQVSPSPLPTRLPATFRFVKWINENIDNKETTEYIDALISHEIWLHCVLLLIITMHQHDETPQAHIVGKRDPDRTPAPPRASVWCFVRASVTPARLWHQLRNLFHKTGPLSSLALAILLLRPSTQCLSPALASPVYNSGST